MELFLKILNGFQLLTILQNVPSEILNKVLNKLLINLLKDNDKNNSDDVQTANIEQLFPVS